MHLAMTEERYKYGFLELSEREWGIIDGKLIKYDTKENKIFQGHMVENGYVGSIWKEMTYVPKYVPSFISLLDIFKHKKEIIVIKELFSDEELKRIKSIKNITVVDCNINEDELEDIRDKAQKKYFTYLMKSHSRGL